jgi:hypothetical protein
VAERGGRPGVSHVAYRREREAAAERRAVDRGDNGPRDCGGDVEEALRGLVEAPLVIVVASELRPVHPGTERGAGSGDDDDGDVGVAADPLEDVGGVDAELDRERVALLGPVERDGCDAVRRIDQNQV